MAAAETTDIEVQTLEIKRYPWTGREPIKVSPKVRGAVVLYLRWPTNDVEQKVREWQGHGTQQVQERLTQRVNLVLDVVALGVHQPHVLVFHVRFQLIHERDIVDDHHRVRGQSEISGMDIAV